MLPEIEKIQMKQVLPFRNSIPPRLNNYTEFPQLGRYDLPKQSVPPTLLSASTPMLAGISIPVVPASAPALALAPVSAATSAPASVPASAPASALASTAALQ